MSSTTEPIAARSVSVERRYTVAGVRLHLSADAPELLVGADRLLARFGERAGERSTRPSAFHLHVQQARSGCTHHEPPASSTTGMGEVWRGPSSLGPRSVNFAGPGARRRWIEGLGQLDVEFGARTAELQVADAAEHTRFFLVPLLAELFDRAGGVSLHAATLRRDRGAHRHGVLVLARSGRGKTTSTLALTDYGWRLMGDDLAFVKPADARHAVWGFPRPCNVRRPTIALLPWLQALPLEPTPIGDEYRLPLQALGDRVTNDQTFVPLSLVICLDPRGHGAHQWRRLDPAGALMRIADEAVQPIEGPTDAIATAMFDRLARLVEQTPVVQLCVGEPLRTLPAEIDAMLRSPTPDPRS